MYSTVQLKTQARSLTTDERDLGLILEIAQFTDYTIDHSKLFINLVDKDTTIVTIKFTDVNALLRVTEDIDFRLRMKTMKTMFKKSSIGY
jgi:hypothetical protein